MEYPVHFVGGWSYPSECLSAAIKPWRLPAMGSIHTFEVDIQRLVAQPAPYILAGWSLGGLRILDAIGSGTLKPAALILISSTARFCADEAYEHGIQRAGLRTMIAGVRKQREKALERFYHDARKPETAHAHDLMTRIRQSGSFPTDKLIRGLQWLDELDARSCVQSMKIPTLILHGKQDAIIPYEAAEWLHGAMTGSVLHIHPDEGHELFINQPDWISARMNEFLQTLI